MPRYVTVLHISDLHFVKQLTIEPHGRLARMIHTVKAKPHSFSKVEAFWLRVEKLKEEEHRQVDLVLGTGDLTTNGDPHALMVVRKFVDDSIVSLGHPEREITAGLGTSKDNRLLLPGNHDRYSRNWLPVQTRSNTFETVLDTPRHYPYVVGYRPSHLPNQESEPALLFYVFDSTPSVAVNYWPFTLFATRSFKPWQLTARGRVEDAECRALIRLSREIIQHRTVKGLNGEFLNVNFDACIRIAVLHHHPFDRNTTTLMENSDLFIENSFKAGIDFLLFGHDHRSYDDYIYASGPYDPASVVNEYHRLHMFCCPSTSEYSSRNGFYIFDFYRDEAPSGFSFELYEWDTAARDFSLTKKQYVVFDRPF